MKRSHTMTNLIYNYIKWNKDHNLLKATYYRNEIIKMTLDMK